MDPWGTPVLNSDHLEYRPWTLIHKHISMCVLTSILTILGYMDWCHALSHNFLVNITFGMPWCQPHHSCSNCRQTNSFIAVLSGHFCPFLFNACITSGYEHWDSRVHINASPEKVYRNEAHKIQYVQLESANNGTLTHAWLLCNTVDPFKQWRTKSFPIHILGNHISYSLREMWVPWTSEVVSSTSHVG